MATYQHTQTAGIQLGEAREDCPLEDSYKGKGSYIWSSKSGDLWANGKQVGTIEDTSSDILLCLDMTFAPYQLWMKTNGSDFWQSAFADMPKNRYHFIVAVQWRAACVRLTEIKLFNETF
eukprot:Filipodium_phascolosomae@DN74_c0_g1_i1.p1